MKKSIHVLLGVTGSIAAYKAAELVRQVKTRGWNVTVVMTRGAAQFVGELTFRTLSQNPVGLEMFNPGEQWCPEHISYAENKSVFVIAPCTANVMAKLAHGIADDLLTCTALACTAPLVIAPAMNDHMWEHPATQENARILRQRGVAFVEAETGDLACGRVGKGRMAAVETIMKTIEKTIGVKA